MPSKWDKYADPTPAAPAPQSKWDKYADKPAPTMTALPKQSPSMLGQTADDASRQLLNGLTFGFGDNLEAAVAALPILGDKRSDESYGQAYRRNLDATRGSMSRFKENNPKTAVALDVAGAAVPALITGGTTTPAVMPSLGARVATGAGLGAVYGGLSSAGNANQDSIPDFVKNAATGAAWGAAGGAALPLIGAGMRKAAEGFADSALGIGMKDRRYGKTPAQAILDETHGITPSAVENSARDRMTQLQNQLAAAGRGRRVDIQPAQDLAQHLADTEAQGINQPLAQELQQVSSSLRDAPPNFYGAMPAPGQIAPLQSVPDVTRLKREFSDRWINWNSQVSPTASSRAKQVYRSLDNAMDAAVPEAAGLNQRISSLIPVAQRAEARTQMAGVPQRALHRVAAHTGALLGGAAGYHYGGLPGLLAGVVGPEIMASTPAQMIAARGLNLPTRSPQWLDSLTRYGASQGGRMLMPPPALNSPEGNQQ